MTGRKNNGFRDGPVALSKVVTEIVKRNGCGCFNAWLPGFYIQWPFQRNAERVPTVPVQTNCLLLRFVCVRAYLRVGTRSPPSVPCCGTRFV